MALSSKIIANDQLTSELLNITNRRFTQTRHDSIPTASMFESQVSIL